MKIGSLIKDALILFAITLVLSIILSVAKVNTQPLVDKASQAKIMKAYSSVCEGYATSDDITGEVVGASAGFNASLTSSENGVMRCKNADGENIGYIVCATGSGYGGNLNLIVGFDLDGKVTGVAYAETPSETPGLGMKSTAQSFLDKWKGVDTNTVSGVDGISGATITSTGFKEAMSLACMFADRAKTMDGR